MSMPTAAPEPEHCQLVELRQYTLHPQQRDVLIELFDREFVETQEAAGMRVIGQFRDLDDADRFVWLRGFADMAARPAPLQAFYGGPVWAAHRDAANATMVDSDNVLLLRPAWPTSGLRGRAEDRAAPGTALPPRGALHTTVFALGEPAAHELIDLVRRRIAGVVRTAGAVAQGWYVTEPAANNFVRLPVREGEPVLVGLALFSDAAALHAFAQGAWPREVLPALARWLRGPPQSMRLAPTARSALHA